MCVCVCDQGILVGGKALVCVGGTHEGEREGYFATNPRITCDCKILFCKHISYPLNTVQFYSNITGCIQAFRSHLILTSHSHY